MNTTRRKLLSSVVALGAAGFGLSRIPTRSGARATASFASESVAIDAPDGELLDLSIAPAGTIEWTGLDAPADELAVTLAARLAPDGEFATLGTVRKPVRGLSGRTTYAFARRDLLGGDPFVAGDFEPTGDSRTRTVELRFALVVTGATGAVVLSEAVSDRFTVTVDAVSGTVIETPTPEPTTAATTAETTETSTATSTTTVEETTAQTTETTTATSVPDSTLGTQTTRQE
jgi:hypothetical protein